MPPERRRVVLDADINHKLARELQRRGRADATALLDHGLEELKDGALLKALAEGYEPCVLVTWDNRMPTAHAQELTHFGTTLAVVNRRGLPRWSGSEHHYVRNAVHRWLHRIEVQPAASIYLYAASVRRL